MCNIHFFHWLFWPPSISIAICGTRGLRLNWEEIKCCCCCCCFRWAPPSFLFGSLFRSFDTPDIRDGFSWRSQNDIHKNYGRNPLKIFNIYSKTPSISILRCTRGCHPLPLHKVFQIFENTIYSKRLIKLNKTFSNCSFILWVNFDITTTTTAFLSLIGVHHFWRYIGNYKFHVGLAKNQLFWHNFVLFSSFLHQISEIRECVHFVSIWIDFALISVISWLFKKIVKPKKKSKMADQMTSYGVITSNNCIDR